MVLLRSLKQPIGFLEASFAGSRVIVPAIVELKRELLRAGKTMSLMRLDAFVNATPDRYLAPQMKHYAELLISGRSRGRRAN